VSQHNPPRHVPTLHRQMRCMSVENKNRRRQAQGGGRVCAGGRVNRERGSPVVVARGEGRWKADSGGGVRVLQACQNCSVR